MGLGVTLPITGYTFLDGNPGVSALVSGSFELSIDGRPYKADTSFEPYRREAFRQRSLAASRQSVDYSNIPGEGTISTDGLWRREAQEWGLGAGQTFADRRSSDPSRFRQSKGIDPWTPWQITLLKDTTQLVASADSDLQSITVGNFVYLRSSTTLQFSSDGVVWTTVTGLPGALKYIASDGFDVFVACGASGVYLTSVGAASAASWITGTANFVAYVGNRLMVSAANNLYNVTTSTGTAGPTALPTALMTHSDANFVWSSFTGGSGWIYVAGQSGNYSEIYRTQVEPNGTTLTAPVLSAPMPHGELVYSLYAYVNFVCVGTNLGQRFCQTLGVNDPGGNSGDLKLGPVTPVQTQQVSRPVRCFTGQFRFIYFAWSNYDGTSTGLGRMDISHFFDTQAPAYTSDLMVAGQGDVLSADWWNGAPIFTVAGKGLYTAASTYVPSATLDSGYYTFGLPDDKVAMIFDVKPLPTSKAGSYSASISADGVVMTTTGTALTANGKTEYDLDQIRGELLETELQLFPSADKTQAPVLTRALLKSYPAIVAGSMISAVIDLSDTVQTVFGADHHFDPYFEWDYLENLRQTQKVVEYVEGPYSALVLVTEIDRIPEHQRDVVGGGFHMILVVYMKTIGG